MKILLIICLLLSIGMLSSECWDDEEVSELEFIELDDVIVLSFKNALDCKPIRGIEVSMFNQKVKTDANGYVRLPLFLIEEIDDQNISFLAKKTGFITLNSEN